MGSHIKKGLIHLVIILRKDGDSTILSFFYNKGRVGLLVLMEHKTLLTKPKGSVIGGTEWSTGRTEFPFFSSICCRPTDHSSRTVTVFVLRYVDNETIDITRLTINNYFRHPSLPLRIFVLFKSILNTKKSFTVVVCSKGFVSLVDTD